MKNRRNAGAALTNGGATRMKTQPIAVQRTTRPSIHRILTSFEPGYMIPVMTMPLLREDSVASAAFRIAFEMKETVEVLMNAVNARVLTYLVPKTALARFSSGIDTINRSYEGIPEYEGGSVVPWFETMAAPAHGANAILKKLGKHAKPGTLINTDILEAYNAIWNFRAKNRSPDIVLRALTDYTLAPAFWLNQTFAHIVPDFDQAMIDGQVPLNVLGGQLPVSFTGGKAAVPALNVEWRDSGNVVRTIATPASTAGIVTNNSGTGGATTLKTLPSDAPVTFTDIFAELAQDGITVSLSNIELARKTQAFAALRRQYNGHSDEYIIDLLMDGISIPDQAWKQPILLADTATQFGMSKRYASDGASLTESVVNGATIVEQRFAVPRCPMGGVIMMVVEVSPEQLFERQEDPYLHATSVDAMPQFLRDTLDPEKVVIVRNGEIDVDHDTANDTFGYAPLNHQWMRNQPAIGGKFYRPQVDAGFDEDRQRIWAVETQNPVLSEDFYLCTSMHQKPFVVTTGDNFEVLIRGEAAIRGNTVFGGMLVEATNDYQEVFEEAPMERLDKDV